MILSLHVAAGIVVFVAVALGIVAAIAFAINHWGARSCAKQFLRLPYLSLALLWRCVLSLVASLCVANEVIASCFGYPPSLTMLPFSQLMLGIWTTPSQEILKITPPCYWQLFLILGHEACAFTEKSAERYLGAPHLWLSLQQYGIKPWEIRALLDGHYPRAVQAIRDGVRANAHRLVAIGRVKWAVLKEVRRARRQRCPTISALRQAHFEAHVRAIVQAIPDDAQRERWFKEFLGKGAEIFDKYACDHDRASRPDAAWEACIHQALAPLVRSTYVEAGTFLGGVQRYGLALQLMHQAVSTQHFSDAVLQAKFSLIRARVADLPPARLGQLSQRFCADGGNADTPYNVVNAYLSVLVGDLSSRAGGASSVAEWLWAILNHNILAGYRFIQLGQAVAAGPLQGHVQRPDVDFWVSFFDGFERASLGEAIVAHPDGALIFKALARIHCFHLGDWKACRDALLDGEGRPLITPARRRMLLHFASDHAKFAFYQCLGPDNLLRQDVDPDALAEWFDEGGHARQPERPALEAGEEGHYRWQLFERAQQEAARRQRLAEYYLQLREAIELNADLPQVLVHTEPEKLDWRRLRCAVLTPGERDYGSSQVLVDSLELDGTDDASTNAAAQGRKEALARLDAEFAKLDGRPSPVANLYGHLPQYCFAREAVRVVQPLLNDANTALAQKDALRSGLRCIEDNLEALCQCLYDPPEALPRSVLVLSRLINAYRAREGYRPQFAVDGAADRFLGSLLPRQGCPPILKGVPSRARWAVLALRADGRRGLPDVSGFRPEERSLVLAAAASVQVLGLGDGPRLVRALLAHRREGFLTDAQVEALTHLADPSFLSCTTLHNPEEYVQLPQFNLACARLYVIRRIRLHYPGGGIVHVRDYDSNPVFHSACEAADGRWRLPGYPLWRVHHFRGSVAHGVTAPALRLKSCFSPFELSCVLRLSLSLWALNLLYIPMQYVSACGLDARWVLAMELFILIDAARGTLSGDKVNLGKLILSFFLPLVAASSMYTDLETTVTWLIRDVVLAMAISHGLSQLRHWVNSEGFRDRLKGFLLPPSLIAALTSLRQHFGCESSELLAEIAAPLALSSAPQSTGQFSPEGEDPNPSLEPSTAYVP